MGIVCGQVGDGQADMGIVCGQVGDGQADMGIVGGQVGDGQADMGIVGGGRYGVSWAMDRRWTGRYVYSEKIAQTLSPHKQICIHFVFAYIKCRFSHE